MDNPVADLREAARLMRERATAATPGPWERPLDTRHRNVVGAELPGDETGQFKDGVVPDYMTSGYTGRYRGLRERVCVVSCETWSGGAFTRKRNGRDLEYIASMHPGVALAVADLLDRIAWMCGIDKDLLSRVGSDEAVGIARAYLGRSDA